MAPHMADAAPVAHVSEPMVKGEAEKGTAEENTHGGSPASGKTCFLVGVKHNTGIQKRNGAGESLTHINSPRIVC